MGHIQGGRGFEDSALATPPHVGYTFTTEAEYASMDDKSLDRFGELLIKGLRDNAIGVCDDLAKGQLIARSWKPLQDGFAELTEEQRWLVHEVVVAAVECGIDQFLQGIRHSGLSIKIEGMEIGNSDVDLVGQIGSWIKRFSEYPEYTG
jgi:hypothetical protein